MNLLLWIGIILIILWLLGFTMNVVGGLVHIILVVAIVLLVLHFVRGKPRV